MSNEAPTDALRLVPCPFCGGDVINTRSQEMTKGPAYYWHKCETCGAESEGDYGEDVAVAAWNRRAAPASPLPGGGLPADVMRLVVAARRVAYEGAAEDDLRALDIAAEAFASRVPWDDEPDELPAAPTGEPK